MHVLISCPYPLESLHGNSVSAQRLESVIREAGYQVKATFDWDGSEAEALIALHAVRSADAVRRFRRGNPQGKVVVVLTGTDLYRDLLNEASVGHRVLEEADRLVVTQDVDLEGILARYQDKVVVIHKSVVLPQFPGLTKSGQERGREQEDVLTLVTVGHMRATKDPFRAVEAIGLKPDLRLRLWQLGEARELGTDKIAHEWEQRESRYQWLGGLPREQSLRLMARSWGVMNTSLVEGGSNAILEAMSLRVPVLATRIEANEGLLGRDYEGFFKVGETEACADLIERFVQDAKFRKSLKNQMERRLPLFQRRQEVIGWRQMLVEMRA